MRTILLAILAAAAAACGATVSETRDQYGERALRIECGARVEECESKAKEICPRGHDVLQAGENRTIVTSGTPGSSSTMVMPEHLMTVRCR
ncbi:MAG: hypothetical protein ACREIP_09870 [Alphaproteobacteria bacterium]